MVYVLLQAVQGCQPVAVLLCGIVRAGRGVPMCTPADPPGKAVPTGLSGCGLGRRCRGQPGTAVPTGSVGGVEEICKCHGRTHRCAPTDYFGGAVQDWRSHGRRNASPTGAFGGADWVGGAADSRGRLSLRGFRGADWVGGATDSRGRLPLRIGAAVRCFHRWGGGFCRAYSSNMGYFIRQVYIILLWLTPLFSAGFDVLEIAVGLVDQLEVGEGMIIFGHDLPEIIELVLND